MAKSYLFNQTPNWSRRNLNFILSFMYIQYIWQFLKNKCNIYTNVSTIPFVFYSYYSLFFHQPNFPFMILCITYFMVLCIYAHTRNHKWKELPQYFSFFVLFHLMIKFCSCISFLEKSKCRIGKTILTKAILNIRNSGHPIILDSNLYDRNIVIKTTRSCHKNRHADQWI